VPLNYSTANVVAAVLYLLFAVITFGFLFRAGRRGLARRVVQAFVSLFWPLYWITVHGVTATFALAINHLAAIIRSLEVLPNAIVSVFTPFVPALQWLWVIGMLSFPAYYIATQWGACSGWGCLGMIGLSVLWAPFWPVYAAIQYF